MTALGYDASSMLRIGDDPRAPRGRGGALERGGPPAAPTAGEVRLALATRDDALAASIEAVSLAAGASVTRSKEFDLLRPRGTRSEPVDVVVLDYAWVPDVSRAIRLLRSGWPLCGIIVLNVSGIQRCASLLDEGADDACTPDCSLVVERLHALVRRARTLNAGFRSAIGDLVVDREHRRVWCACREVGLSAREYDLLLCLFDRSPRIVPTSTLASIVWRGHPEPSRNMVEVYVGYVRRKLAASGAVGIRTVRGAGYVLDSNASGR